MEIGSFGIKEQIEIHPLGDAISQNVLTAWCEAHDGIRPKMVDRKEWKRDGTILRDNENGKKDLEIPFDIHLWELLDVVRAIDDDSYKDGIRAEKGSERQQKLAKLGYVFENAAVYIAKRLDGVVSGREIAEEMIEGFYKYGKSLQSGQEYETITPIAEIAKQPLDDGQIEEVDKWLAGKEYEFLKNRAMSGNQALEEARKMMLTKYFRVSQALLETDTVLDSSADAKKSFLERLRARQGKAINSPVQELDSAIFDRGMETMMNGIMAELRFWEIFGGKTVHERVNIPKLKAEVDLAREAVARASESEKRKKLRALGKVEIRAARAIQEEVRRLEGKDIFNPTEIVDAQALNCVGFSMFGGTLFEEAGLKYLSVSAPAHSVIILVTSDNRLIYMEMQTSENREIVERDLYTEGATKSRDATIEEIANMVNDGKFESAKFRFRLHGWKEDGDISQSIAMGNRGYIASIYYSLGTRFFNPAEQEKCLRKAIELDGSNPDYYYILGNVLSNPAEKEKCYRKAIELDNSDSMAYFRLGTTLASQKGRYSEALEVLRYYVKMEENGGHSGSIINIARAEIVRLESSSSNSGAF